MLMSLRRSFTASRQNTAPACRSGLVDDGEASRFGEYPCGRIEVRKPGGEGSGRQAFRERLTELETDEGPVVHLGQAEPVSSVSSSRLPHFVGQVGAHANAGVIKALDAVGQLGKGRGEGGVGAVAGPGPPADVLTCRGNDGAGRMHGMYMVVAYLGEDTLRPSTYRASGWHRHYPDR